MVEPLVAEPFCEVPHMAAAHIGIVRREGWGEVVLAPFTGWDYIEEFLKAGLIARVIRPNFGSGVEIPPADWRRILRRWQQRARRNYGVGRLLEYRPMITPARREALRLRENRRRDLEAMRCPSSGLNPEGVLE